MLGMELKPEDRGWNDPPVVTFSDTNQLHKRGRLLNKRVAFPINGSALVPNVGAGYSMQNSPMQPPMSTPVGQENYAFSGAHGVPGGNSFYPSTVGSYYPQQPQPTQYSQVNTQPPSSFMSSGIVEHPQPIQYQQQTVLPSNPVSATDTIMQCDESLQNLRAAGNTLSPQILDEVNQHLHIMETMWKENKLPPEVCDLVFQLSVALCQGNRDYAESLLSSISTNYFDCCHGWISGPRSILQAAIGQAAGN